jgi:hypothetical protein
MPENSLGKKPAAEQNGAGRWTAEPKNSLAGAGRRPLDLDSLSMYLNLVFEY